MIDDAQHNPSALAHLYGGLLLTKLRSPRAASDGVVRDRLIHEIDRGTEGKLTLIVTPPGYGKTTLVSQWQTQTSRASAWLSLDTTDNDFSVFFEYVIAAIQSIDPSMCLESAAMVRAPSQPPARQLIALLINEIAESTRPFVLIVDDYHVITSEEVQDAVQQLLQLMPANMSLILTSRREPALPTLRMNARGELVELGALDLSFTAEEAREFFFERQQLDLQRSEVDAIQRWAEGWPVALRLVVGALRGRSQERVHTLLEALTDNVPSVSDYLWDEAIGSQSTERSTFLLRSAILRQFNPDVAGVVTEMPNAEELLNGLYRDNLFIARLYGPGSWYRYHHIFADVLRQRLAREIDAVELQGLHARAAAWYEANELTTEAAYHAIQAASWPMATRLLVLTCKEFYDQERVGMLHQWLRDLPDEALAIEPRLAYWLAWSQVRTGFARDARRAVEIAEQSTHVGPATLDADLARLQLQILKSLFAGDVERGSAAAESLLEQLGPDRDSDRARVLTMYGLLLEMSGMLSDAEQVLERARALNGRLGIRGLQVAELSATAILQMSMGKLREPADLFRRVAVIGDEWNDLPLQNALHKLGWISYEWNKLDEALAHASRSGELAERMGAPLHLSQVPALRAQIHAVEGRWDDAFDDIEQAISASIAAGFSHVVPELEEMKCRMWLATDQLTLAQSWLQRVGLDIVQSDRFREVSLALTALRVQMHDGRFAETIGPLERLRRRATAQGWIRALISIQTLRAISESAIGNAATAQAALNEALDLGMTEGFVRTYIDEGPRMVPLLQQVANSEGPRQAYATSLLVAAGAAPPPIATPASQEPSILSPRERDVMKLVASGLSNRDVGDALFISEETVKTHMRRIFEKLEVSSRTQAINRSQQLGLL